MFTRHKTYRLYRQTKTKILNLTVVAAMLVSGLSGALPLFLNSAAIAAPLPKQTAKPTITSPAGPTTIHTDTAVVSGTVGDASLYTIRAYNSNTCAGSPVVTQDKPAGSNGFSVTLPTSTDGLYQFGITAQKHNDDLASNCAAVPDITKAASVVPLPNQAPSVPVLAAPANGTVRHGSYTLPTTNQSSWNASTDPDGDAVTYIYQSAHDAAFTNVAYTSSALTDTFILNPNEPEITYYWHVKAVDSLGNESAWSETWSITIDNTGPTGLSHISPSDGTITTTAGLTSIDWTDATDSHGPVTYFYESSHSSATNADGSFVSPAYQSGALSDSQIPTAGTPEGIYYWHVRAVDSLGNSTVWTSAWKVTVDNTAPTTPAITAPGDGDYFTTSPILNKWTTSTDTNGVATYQIAYNYDDGHSFGGSTCPSLTMPGYSGFIGCRDLTGTQRNHTPSLSEQGGVTIWVRAQDNAGNWSAWSTPVHYYYDATAPSVPTNGQPNLTIKNTNVFDYTWDGSTDNVGPVTYEYQASQNPAESGGVLTTGLWQNWVNGNASQNPLNNPLIPSVGTSDGTWYWQVRAVDAAGNRSAWSDIWHYTLDSHAPIVTIDSYGQSNNVIQPDVTATDPAPGTALSYLWDEHNGVTVSNIHALNPTFTVTTDGTYTFHLTVTDEAGNSTTAPFTFTYTTPPTPTFTNVQSATTTTPPTTTLLNDDTNGTDDPEVLSTTTESSDPGNVEGASTVADTVANAKNNTFLGLGWWWLAILGALAIFWLLFFARRSSEEEN